MGLTGDIQPLWHHYHNALVTVSGLFLAAVELVILRTICFRCLSSLPFPERAFSRAHKDRKGKG